MDSSQVILLALSVEILQANVAVCSRTVHLHIFFFSFAHKGAHRQSVKVVLHRKQCGNLTTSASPSQMTSTTSSYTQLPTDSGEQTSSTVVTEDQRKFHRALTHLSSSPSSLAAAGNDANCRMCRLEVKYTVRFLQLCTLCKQFILLFKRPFYFILYQCLCFISMSNNMTISEGEV